MYAIRSYYEPLRQGGSAFDRQREQHFIRDRHLATVVAQEKLFQQSGLVLIPVELVATPAGPLPGIPSYNVCYTKLFRDSNS